MKLDRDGPILYRALVVVKGVKASFIAKVDPLLILLNSDNDNREMYVFITWDPLKIDIHI